MSRRYTNERYECANPECSQGILTGADDSDMEEYSWVCPSCKELVSIDTPQRVVINRKAAGDLDVGNKIYPSGIAHSRLNEITKLDKKPNGDVYVIVQEHKGQLFSKRKVIDCLPSF